MRGGTSRLTHPARALRRGDRLGVVVTLVFECLTADPITHSVGMPRRATTPTDTEQPAPWFVQAQRPGHVSTTTSSAEPPPQHRRAQLRRAPGSKVTRRLPREALSFPGEATHSARSSPARLHRRGDDRCRNYFGTYPPPFVQKGGRRSSSLDDEAASFAACLLVPALSFPDPDGPLEVVVLGTRCTRQFSGGGVRCGAGSCVCTSPGRPRGAVRQALWTSRPAVRRCRR